jgi:hypothetical protein
MDAGAREIRRVRTRARADLRHLLRINLRRAIMAATYKLPFGHRGGNQPVKDFADWDTDHRAQHVSRLTRRVFPPMSR